MGQHGTHHQNFVFEAGYKQRTDRTVNKTRSQRLFFGRTCFAFEKAAWHFAGCVIFFLVVNGQREKVLTRLLLAGKSHVGHDRCFAQSGDHGSVGLAGHFARFQSERFFAPLDRFFHFVKHNVS